ncbi:MAG: hypothetical protein ABRQ39_08745 [Candidatus Eremiobacterota bacterium]
MIEQPVNTENLPKTYKISFMKLFVPVLWIPLLAAMIAIQINIMMKITGVLWAYIVLIIIETLMLARMISVVRNHLISVTISEEGVAYRQFFPSLQKNFTWENIKRFKCKTVKPAGRVRRKTVKVYALDDKSGDRITFNSLLFNSDELVEAIKKKVKLREWN